jgi:hypothetical protein
MHEWPILVISSGAKDLAFSPTCEEKISRLGLETIIATQSSGEGGNTGCPGLDPRWGLEQFEPVNFRKAETHFRRRGDQPQAETTRYGRCSRSSRRPELAIRV